MIILLAAAVAHLPIFHPSSTIEINAEPSQVVYARRDTTVRVKFCAGDYMYISVMRPLRDGISVIRPLRGEIWKPREEVNATIVGSCVYGAPASASHATNHSSGATVYEPWAEGAYEVVETLRYGHQSDIDQTCTISIIGSPAALVVGTREEGLAWMWFSGLPASTISTSAWANSYTHGIFVGIALLGIGLWICCSRRIEPMWIPCIFFLLTAINRWMNMVWGKPGIGLLWSLQPLLCAVLSGVMARTPSKETDIEKREAQAKLRNLGIFVILLTIVGPERTWVDFTVFVVCFTIKLLD